MNNFDLDKIANKFYEQFKKQHDQFLSFIQGIDDLSEQKWYASLMLNRLMFIYFMQTKGFFDQNKNYLFDKLKQCQLEGKDQFYSFLIRLFREGLSDRTSDLTNLLGKIPSLNINLYQKHWLEKKYHHIYIADVAFENMFTFFDKYDWNLSDRPGQNHNEINPDILGYILEKYTNQKQTGAYYTKEDITEYISKNCIIPYLFDSALTLGDTSTSLSVHSATGDGNKSAFQLLKNNPDRYIYDSVRFGVNLSLPPEIERGINDISQRNDWNKPAFSDYGLPTETWREHINRRQRYFDLIAKIANNEITSINDFITYNFNIRQFIQDVIANCNNPQIIWQFYQSLTQITILDPTCGSGAFLFAALNILEPIYEVCLEKMQIFIDDNYRPHPPTPSPTGEGEIEILANFNHVINQINSHTNRIFINDNYSP
ncbi:MAG TPA: hypothetical protein V6C58_00775, partial [Allocoleopsis sp.]